MNAVLTDSLTLVLIAHRFITRTVTPTLTVIVTLMLLGLSCIEKVAVVTTVAEPRRYPFNTGPHGDHANSVGEERGCA